MTTLAAALLQVRELAASLPARKFLPTDQRRPTRRVLERLLKALDIVPELPEARLAEVRREVLAAQKKATLAGLPMRTLRDSVWLLWPKAGDGIDRNALRRAILSRVDASKSMLRRLIEVWLLNFQVDSNSFTDVGRQIERQLGTEQRGTLGGWKEIHRSHELFRAGKGPGRIAFRILEEGTETVLAACRLNTPSRAKSGYLRAVHMALSQELPARMSKGDSSDVLERAMSFYAPQGELRFDERVSDGAMADALVAPWIDNRRPPPDRLRLEVLTFLRKHLGDPRVDTRKRWSGASIATRNAMRAWLSKLSLDAFFNVVGRFAESAGMDHHWKAREAFWGACLDRNRIDDSWLVLGDNVARAVRNHRELQGSYGYLAGGSANHSVLLMRIGKIIFAEWSHNGSLRAWASDWKNAPNLFEATYSRLELMSEGMAFPPPRSRPDLPTTGNAGLAHHPGVWQGRVAELLRRREGFELQEKDWSSR